MKIIAVIPARYQASRFPGKLMQPLGDSTVIGQTYKNVLETALFSEVIVATDNDEIQKEIEALGGSVFRSQKEHDCGSDRIAEAVEHSDADIVINIQGDEPFLNHQSLKALIEVF
ncbi:MAG: cytidylyltransferase domain-containing protein, partial [Flavobacteriaceae bacterium]